MKYIESLRTFAANNTTTKVLYVSSDEGSDSNDGSLLSPFLTIQAAINAAEALPSTFNTPVVIKVYPSMNGNTYTENLTFTQQGVTLESISSVYHNNAVTIHGNITVNLTGTAGGGNLTASQNLVVLSGLILASTSSSPIVNFTGSAFQRLFLLNCIIDNNGSGAALNSDNSGVSGSTKSTITIRDTDLSNGDATNATIILSAGRIFIAGANPNITNGNAGGQSLNQSGATSFTVNGAGITGQVNVSSNTANCTITLSTIASGSLACVVTPSSPSTGVITVALVGFTTTATNTITGSGVVVPAGGNSKLSTGGDIISTVTQAVLSKFPEGQTLLGAGSTAVTNSLLILKNGHITSQQTTAPTSALQAGAGTTATRTLTRCTDVAGNISITTNGAGIAAGAQLIVTFNKAYATAPVVNLTPNNVNSPLLIGAYVTSTTTTFTISFAAAGIAATAYNFYYQIIET